jgi:5'/3'-nucleotidase SurE
MRILLTNDDSHDSPLFLLAISLLQELGELTIVVPAQEQSWKGKAMTRFSDLYADRIDLHGTPAILRSMARALYFRLAEFNTKDRNETRRQTTYRH